MHIPGVATLMYSVFEYNWNLKLINLVVVEGENQRSWQKTLRERTRTNNKLSPSMMPNPEFN